MVAMRGRTGAKTRTGSALDGAFRVLEELAGVLTDEPALLGGVRGGDGVVQLPAAVGQLVLTRLGEGRVAAELEDGTRIGEATGTGGRPAWRAVGR
jgi:hypothetical protein